MRDGHGVIRYPEEVRVVILPRCIRCKKVAPECLCGLNAARKEKE